MQIELGSTDNINLGPGHLLWRRLDGEQRGSDVVSCRILGAVMVFVEKVTAGATETTRRTTVPLTSLIAHTACKEP